MVRHFLKDPSVSILAATRGTYSELEELAGDRLRYLPGIDLLNESDVAALRLATSQEFDAPFVLVHAVGHHPGQAPLSSLTLANARTIVDANLTTFVNACAAFVPLMEQVGGGTILGFGCNSTTYHYPNMAVFTAAKSGVESLVASIAHECAKSGVVANALTLSTVNTSAERTMKPYGDHGSWMGPDEVAEVIESLLGEDRRLINGNAISLFRYSETFYGSSFFDRNRVD